MALGMSGYHQIILKLKISLLMVLILASCNKEEGLRTFCGSDSNCPPGFRCDTQTGLCICTTDEVCGPDEYCHPDGRCQKRMSCDNNLDCPEDTFCNTTTGNCAEIGVCTEDVHCASGQICKNFRCISGCWTEGDCLLRDVCITDGKEFGSCRSGLCVDKSYCDYGQLCNPETLTCYDDTRGPYCEPCKPTTVGDPFSCGPGPNFCVMTNNDPSLEPFCGVDCGQNQDCPFGYSCNLILIAPEQSCRSDQECESGQCHINEGDQVGFCLCISDDQCPQDSCNETTSQCWIRRNLCRPESNDCDRPIYCIDGLCLIGRNCTPAEGLDCADFGK